MGSEGEGESGVTAAPGNCVSVSLGQPGFSLSAFWLFSVHLLCFFSSQLVLLTHRFSTHLSFQLVAPLPPGLVSTQTFCCPTRYHQRQLSSECLCSNPRNNPILFKTQALGH